VKRNLPNGETDTVPVPLGALDETPCDYLPTCNCFVRRADFEALGGFDPAYGIFVEDKDLCHRLRARGLDVVADRRTWVLHDIALEGRTGDLYLCHRNRVRFVLKHYPWRDVVRLPARDVAYVLSPRAHAALRRGDVNVVKHLAPWMRERLYAPGTSEALRLAAVGTAYAAALGRAYLWNVAHLGRTLAERRRDGVPPC